MKNLKVFVAPVLAATFLVSCGNKSMDVKDFKTKVDEALNLESLKDNYVGKTTHLTGTELIPFGGEQKIDEKATIENIDDSSNYPNFVVSDYKVAFSPTSILSSKFIDYYVQSTPSEIKHSFTIDGDNYIIESEGKTTEGGVTQNGKMKMVFNKDLVITHYEGNSEETSSGQKLTLSINLDYKYE